MTDKPNDLCIPVDPHDYEHDPLTEPTDEFGRNCLIGPNVSPGDYTGPWVASGESVRARTLPAVPRV